MRLLPLVLFASFINVAAADTLPNLDYTPGVARDITIEQVCTTKWRKDRRHVTAKMINNVYLRYGIQRDARRNNNGKLLYQMDHLISREIGGADVEQNLWPEPLVGSCNAYHKDRLENALHREICANPSDEILKQTQQSIAANWIAEYEKRYGSCQ